MGQPTILLRNGLLIDGSGAAPVRGDLLISGERIAAVGRFDPPADAEVIDCGEAAIAPGFIDAHSHSDLQVLENRHEKSDQGVTTEVVGNCGFSPYPFVHDRAPLQEFANGILYGGSEWGWPNAGAYLDEVERKASLASVFSLIGHGSLRVAVAGHRQGPLPEEAVRAMEALLSDALEAGACGLSTGLMYAPGSSAPFEELLRLCKVVARHNRIYTTHMRSYSWTLLEALDEQLALARQSGCRLQISHLQAVGQANWDKQARALEKIEQARAEGIDVAFDIYPYTAGSTVMTQFLPQWALDGGNSAMLARLADSPQRAEITAQVRDQTAQRWSDILVTSVRTAANQPLLGKSLADIAALRDLDPIETMLRILEEEQGEVNIVSFNQSESNLRSLLTHPLCIVISDGFYVKGLPHPRLYGTFPMLLSEICRTRRWMPLEEAIHKVTAKPALRFRMPDRGLLQPGMYADITVFDAGRVSTPATYADPMRRPEGITHVFRKGRQLAGAAA
ncbi:MAG TPA: D-aminoacylase [Bryobacteraceae bacterium]|nr:D-aminoacylase [Bryobacteraceae bacterium]